MLAYLTIDDRAPGGELDTVLADYAQLDLAVVVSLALAGPGGGR